jgi:hypothetical protein
LCGTVADSGVDKGESEIGGSGGRRVQKRAARGSRKVEPRRNGFTEAKRRKFLNHFAATCNAKAAARAAGVSNSTVHEWRRKNERFRADFYAALELGYVEIEAELVRESKRSLKPRPDPKAPPLVDPKTALSVLESYRRNGNRRPGDVLPQRSDVEQVRARLETAMRALALLPDAEGGEGEGEA